MNELYRELRDYLDEVPVIDAHEHYFMGTDPQPCDVMEVLISSYAMNDLETVSVESAAELEGQVFDFGRSLDDRFEDYMKQYACAKHTAYNRAVLRGIKACWGIDEINRETVHDLQEKISTSRNNDFYRRMMEKYHVKAMLIDPCDNDEKVSRFAGGEDIKGYSEECRFTLSLPMYHGNYPEAPGILSRNTGIEVKDLDSMVAAFDAYLTACMKRGVVAIKDQSAYGRTICFDRVEKSVAEELLARALKGERLAPVTEDCVLGNYLMREYMRLAGEKGMPVQMHTGFQAGLCTELTHTKAIHLTSLLNDNPNTHFDLFHGSWPYMDEYLFLGKNYPNVSLDLCWVQIIDPLYSIELMKRAVMTIPTNKIIAFGGDESSIENTIGGLCIARDNVARALSELIAEGWIDMSAAKAIVADWFFNNPNTIFKLGFEPFKN